MSSSESYYQELDYSQVPEAKRLAKALENADDSVERRLDLVLKHIVPEDVIVHAQELHQAGEGVSDDERALCGRLADHSDYPTKMALKPFLHLRLAATAVADQLVASAYSCLLYFDKRELINFYAECETLAVLGSQLLSLKRISRVFEMEGIHLAQDAGVKDDLALIFSKARINPRAFLDPECL